MQSESYSATLLNINGLREYLGKANGNCVLDTSKISVHKWFDFKVLLLGYLVLFAHEMYSSLSYSVINPMTKDILGRKGIIMLSYILLSIIKGSPAENWVSQLKHGQ